jgi:hypothetical protein
LKLNEISFAVGCVEGELTSCPLEAATPALGSVLGMSDVDGTTCARDQLGETAPTAIDARRNATERNCRFMLSLSFPFARFQRPTSAARRRRR